MRRSVIAQGSRRICNSYATLRSRRLSAAISAGLQTCPERSRRIQRKQSANSLGMSEIVLIARSGASVRYIGIIRAFSAGENGRRSRLGSYHRALKIPTSVGYRFVCKLRYTVADETANDLAERPHTRAALHAGEPADSADGHGGHRRVGRTTGRGRRGASHREYDCAVHHI